MNTASFPCGSRACGSNACTILLRGAISQSDPACTLWRPRNHRKSVMNDSLCRSRCSSNCTTVRGWKEPLSAAPLHENVSLWWSGIRAEALRSPGLQASKNGPTQWGLYVPGGPRRYVSLRYRERESTEPELSRLEARPIRRGRGFNFYEEWQRHCPWPSLVGTGTSAPVQSANKFACGCLSTVHSCGGFASRHQGSFPVGRRKGNFSDVIDVASCSQVCSARDIVGLSFPGRRWELRQPRSSCWPLVTAVSTGPWSFRS